MYVICYMLVICHMCVRQLQMPEMMCEAPERLFAEAQKHLSENEDQ